MATPIYAQTRRRSAGRACLRPNRLVCQQLAWLGAFMQPSGRNRRWPTGMRPSLRKSLSEGATSSDQTTKDGALWSPVVATGGISSQIGPPRNPQTYAKTVASGCDLLPESFHGKESVDGSSPSEGFDKSPATGHGVLPRMARCRVVAGTRRVHFGTEGSASRPRGQHRVAICRRFPHANHRPFARWCRRAVGRLVRSPSPLLCRETSRMPSSADSRFHHDLHR
jgi:hypothetical protein